MIYDHPLKLTRSLQKAAARLQTLGYSTGPLRAGDAAYFHTTTPQGRRFEVIVREVSSDEEIANLGKPSEAVRTIYVDLGAEDYAEVQRALAEPPMPAEKLRARLAAAREYVVPVPSELVVVATRQHLAGIQSRTNDQIDYADWLLREWAALLPTRFSDLDLPPKETATQADLRRMTDNCIADYKGADKDRLPAILLLMAWFAT